MKKCEEFAPLLSAFVDGELTEEERAEVLAHVSECEKCRRLLGELTALHAALGELEDEDVPAGFTEGVMAAGAFVQGSSIELSADGPTRPPYAVYFQGGLTWYHAKLGILMSLQKMLEAGLISL